MRLFSPIAAALLSGLGLFAPAASAPAQTTIVADSERTSLVLTKDGVTSRLLGFVVPDPGPDFRLVDELPTAIHQQLAAKPSMYAWMFQRSDSGAVVIILVAKGLESDRDFASFMHGFRGRGARPGAQVVKDTLSVEGGARDFRFIQTFPGGMTSAIRCITSPTSPVAGLLVCVDTQGIPSARMDSVRAGLRFGPAYFPVTTNPAQ